MKYPPRQYYGEHVTLDDVRDMAVVYRRRAAAYLKNKNYERARYWNLRAKEMEKALEQPYTIIPVSATECIVRGKTEMECAKFYGENAYANARHFVDLLKNSAFTTIKPHISLDGQNQIA